jgi:hypothetical protein
MMRAEQITPADGLQPPLTSVVMYLDIHFRQANAQVSSLYFRNSSNMVASHTHKLGRVHHPAPSPVYFHRFAISLIRLLRAIGQT